MLDSDRVNDLIDDINFIELRQLIVDELESGNSTADDVLLFLEPFRSDCADRLNLLLMLTDQLTGWCNPEYSLKNIGVKS